MPSDDQSALERAFESTAQSVAEFRYMQEADEQWLEGAMFVLKSLAPHIRQPESETPIPTTAQGH